MYRKMLLVPVILFTVVGSLVAYHAPLPPVPGALSWTAPGVMKSGLGLTLWFFITDLGIYGLGLLLARSTVFYPGAAYRGWATFGRWAAVFLMDLLAIAVLYDKSLLAGSQARALSLQTGKPIWLALLAAQAPHGLLEMAALGVVLVLPLFWLARGAMAGGLRRATFEGWLEARRIAFQGAALLAAAAATQAYVTPLVITWAMRAI